MRVILIRYSSLGDVVLVTSVARSIKTAYPGAEVDILTKEEYFPVFSHNPDIGRVLSRPPFRERYDYMADLHSSIRSALSRRLIRAGRKMVYNKAATARRVFLHSGMMQGTLEKTVPERYIEPFIQAGLKVTLSKPRIEVSPREEEEASRLACPGPYLALVPGAKWMTKEWFQEKYVQLIIKASRELGLNTVILGTEEEKKLSDSIVAGTGTFRSHVINLAGKTDIRLFAALIKGAAAAVTPDSAALHIGWGLSVPVVALFGPTVKEFGFQPDDEKVAILEKDLECRPCSLHGSAKCRYTDRACMQRIEVHEVIDALRGFL